STVVTATRATGSSALQGATTATASGGIATFTSLSYPLAETITILFSSGSLTNVTSGSVAVSAGTFTKLQLLVPGETAAPGTGSGKTGAPAALTAGNPFTVTVNAVDGNWNLVNSVADTVGITSSDGSAVLPSNAALSAGTQTFSATLKTA